MITNTRPDADADLFYYDDFEIGVVSRNTTPFTVTEADLIAFAQQWDPQPFHTDKKFAEATSLGLFACSPHVIAIAIKQINAIETEKAAAIAALGFDQMRFHAPVRPGDQLSASTEVAEKRLSSSHPGAGIVSFDVALRNQDDALVMSFRIASLYHVREAQTTDAET